MQIQRTGKKWEPPIVLPGRTALENFIFSVQKDADPGQEAPGAAIQAGKGALHTPTSSPVPPEWPP